MKSLIPKIAISTISLGSVTIGVVYATLPEKYNHYLNKKGRALLTKNSDKWEQVKNKYASEGDGLLISINGQEIAKSNLTKEQLENWCLQNSNNNFTNTKDKNYQRVSAWCTEPKSIKEYIGTSRSILKDEDLSGSSNPNESEWTAKKDEYNKLSSTSELIKTISTTTEGANINPSELDNTSKLKTWCKYSKDKHFKHEEDQRFLNYLKWCTIKN